MSDQSRRLYLITAPISDTSELQPMLAGVLEADESACVLLRLKVDDETSAKKIVRTAAAVVQARDTALLIECDPLLAIRGGADGCHVHGIGESLTDALKRLKPERIVGAGRLRTRDEAMSAGESGVDYVMFGEPSADGYVQPFARTVEHVTWWAEIFNVPCVGFAERLEDVAELVRAGADFVALGDAVWNDARGAAAAIRDATASLGAKAQPE